MINTSQLFASPQFLPVLMAAEEERWRSFLSLNILAIFCGKSLYDARKMEAAAYNNEALSKTLSFRNETLTRNLSFRNVHSPDSPSASLGPAAGGQQEKISVVREEELALGDALTTFLKAKFQRRREEVSQVNK